MTFSPASLKKLETCDTRLQTLFNEVIKEQDCTIICGHRGREEQEQAFRNGKSKAKYGLSKHNFLPSCAVDVMPYPINWADLEGLKSFAKLVKSKSQELGIEIKWGGDFKGFFDGPHFELVDTSKSKLAE